ncbi:motile sperm domain-containing protein [Raphidocelis subcapitata]|uniref:Motile sperm domain-containing protein n=1 Tax=Raphidocelis subcapitata TaxID=307507 RepID=A0A2V0NKM0_9CHLO|nr:motile sperm domain-containing protein [Raphidocelis subcapitata]|eukprot:GBF87868.1 motile sperm domain-containing protein [Raphidocelis subcapitata]
MQTHAFRRMAQRCGSAAATAAHTARPLRPRPRAAPRAAPTQQAPPAAAPARGCACRAGPQAAELAPGLRPLPWAGTPEQQQALEDLRARMEAGQYGSPGDDLLKWYLRDRYFIVDDAEEKLTSMLRWREAERIDAVDPSSPGVQAELATGKAFVHSSTDVYGRPVVIIRVRKHVTGEFPIADSKRLAGYVLDQAVASLPPGGEQIMGLFDLRGFELRNADMQFAAFIVEAFFEYYPRRMGQVLMVDSPWIFRPTWELIKPLLRKYAALVRFVDRSELSEFFEPGALPEDLKD